MSVIEEVLDRVTTITFDCYGTLIDWRAGLGRSLSMLLGAGMADRTDKIYETYVRVEAEVEAGGYQQNMLHRAADASELAGAVVLLASPAGSYCQGERFVVDGGEMFRPTYNFTIDQYEGIKKAQEG